MDFTTAVEGLLAGSPWGVAILFVFLFLKERQYSRELVSKTYELINAVNNINEKMSGQNNQQKDLMKQGLKIDALLDLVEDLKRRMK